ncbi:MAG: single-stranded-DNA-specific exonuclease RecJ [Hyphomicrobiales bacterium]|nr:single-stranded-DNA-specific exonuclease RecJ [Hyphomicrobiales bacterium]
MTPPLPLDSPARHPVAPGRPFLGVEASVQGRAWRDRLDIEGQGRAQAIAQLHGHSDLLSRVLAARGVDAETCAAYHDPTIRSLMPDPSVLVDMDATVERLVRAIKTSEKIAIFGDYDVDGACSSALLASYLESCGCPYVIHIPDRLFEGYGPNVDAIRALAADGAGLLVTVDCGTTSFEPIEEAKKLGLDTLVIDHHQAPERLPPALAIVNPNRLDDLSHLGHLCAAGVVYMVLVALHRALRQDGFWGDARPAPDLLADLDLVALATVADVVPLIGLNRAFVTKGLAVMRARGRPGLRQLLDVARADGPPRPYHLGFLIGPRINAGGRIGDAALGAKLLLMKDDIKAGEIAVELDRLNRERQAIEVGTLAEAEAEALLALGLEEQGACVVTAGEGWHPGIVGLVAARLKEKFRRPAFAIAFNGEIGTGSARSIVGVDLGRVVRAAVDSGLLVKGGGHAMAAGLTIEKAKLGAFRAYLEERLTDIVTRARHADSLLVDAAVTAGGANAELCGMIERAGPFGSGNPEPVFVLPNHRIVRATEVGTGHVRVRAVAGDGAGIDAIAFRAGDTALGAALQKAVGGPAHLAGTLSVDRWGGNERVQMRLIDMAIPERARV